MEIKHFHKLIIAEIQKHFGSKGELIIRLRPEAPEEIDMNEPVFITIDGLPVPFYFKSFEPRGTHRAKVEFDDMETMELATELIGKSIWIPSSGKQAIHSQHNDLTGYCVIDEQHGELGKVSAFLDIPGNPCLQVDNQGNELLIPFHDDIIKKTNHKKRLLYVTLPEGLTNM